MRLATTAASRTKKTPQFFRSRERIAFPSLAIGIVLARVATGSALRYGEFSYRCRTVLWKVIAWDGAVKGNWDSTRKARARKSASSF